MAERPHPSEYLANIKASAPQIVSDIKELASAEIVPSAKHAGIGGGLFSAAGVFALFALNCVLWAAVFGVSNFYHYVAGRDWFTSLALAFITLAVLLLILAALVAIIGYRQLKQVKAPSATIAEAKASISALSSSLSAGARDAKEDITPSVTSR
ncbi:Putative Holin-X, holin superfamily III [Propionibacterium cyclohexanicum]|uniref:Putative Holin-X, holin superfamily III n=1 Tax=Propionibacterium cyclohexanicum TaxID=64702 RepID=A0A1H9TCX5_9ACTN|nr:phage holin family protein [Propionibacterium cyclohexanicum]SER94794.1 Putative Holin-X, holin superfamily III [Propionibacterium cyclohexanicum]